MGLIMKDNMVVKMTEPQTIYFDLPKKFDSSLEHETDFIIKQKVLS